MQARYVKLSGVLRPFLPRLALTAVLLFTAAAGCSPGAESAGGHCLLDGSPEQCPVVLAACAAATGRTPLEICRAACARTDGLAYACLSWPAGAEDGLYPAAGLPEVPDAVLGGVVFTLSCSACLLWHAETSCSPGHTFCAAPLAPDRPPRIMRCDERGQSASEAGECSAGHACRDTGTPGTAAPPPGERQPEQPEQPESGAPTQLPPIRFGEARCEAAACPPGVIRCPADGPGIEVCEAREGRGWVAWTSCPEGTAARCGPDPVCLPLDGPACRRDCPEGSRCTLPGLLGEPRVCAAAAETGEACAGDTDLVCAEGLACVVEAGPAEPRLPARGICRPTCNPDLANCPAGMACLPTAAGGVCSAAVQPGQREPCATGLPGVCARGMRDEDGRCQQLVLAAGAEICDGLDNDCDGETDEELVVPGYVRPCPAQGVCRDRPFDCIRGSWVCDLPPSYEQREASCDELDNDCDGETDEGFDLAGDPENCGACERRCDLPGSRPACRQGSCITDCLEGFRDANGQPGDGCEEGPEEAGG